MRFDAVVEAKIAEQISALIPPVKTSDSDILAEITLAQHLFRKIDAQARQRARHIEAACRDALERGCGVVVDGDQAWAHQLVPAGQLYDVSACDAVLGRVPHGELQWPEVLETRRASEK